MSEDINKLINKLNESKKDMRPPEENSGAKTTYKKIKTVEIKNPGIYRFRLFPNKLDPVDLPFEAVNIHLGFVHPNFNKKAPLVCQGKNCPLCIVYQRKQAKNDEYAWKYQAKQRFIYYALDDQNEIVLLSLNYYAHEELLGKILANAKAGINIMDMLEGFWISITLNIVNKKYKYNVAVETESLHKMPRELREEFDRLKPLNKFYLNHTIEELKKLLKGEKLIISYQNDNRKINPAAKPVNKTQAGADIVKPKEKFASDVVDKVGDDKTPEEGSAEDSDNMKRLQDIMKNMDIED